MSCSIPWGFSFWFSVMIATQTAPTSQSIAASLRKSFKAKYEDAAQDLYQLLSRIPHKYAFGIFDTAKGHARYRHKSEVVAIKRNLYPISALSKSQLYRHLLTTTKHEYVWYVNSLPTLHGEKIALLQIDIDDKSHAGDAHELLSHLLLEFPFLLNSYVEASTNGFGIHLYFVVSFPLYMNHADIKDVILSFQKSVTNASLDCRNRFGTVSHCHEVRGTPCVRNGDSFTLGTLVKFPRVDSEQSAFSLISLFESPISFSSLLPLVGDSKSCTVSLPSASLSTSYLSTKKERGEETSPNSNTLDSDSETDAFARTVNLASELMRRLNRIISSTELLAEYAKRFPQAGPQTKQRESRAEQVLAKLGKNFIPSKTGKPSSNPLKYLSELKPLVTEELIAQYFNSKSSTLKVEDVALVLFLLRENANAARFARLPKKFFLAASRKLKAENKIQRTLDNKRLAASKRILEKLGLITVLKKGNQFAGTSEFHIKGEA